MCSTPSPMVFHYSGKHKNEEKPFLMIHYCEEKNNVLLTKVFSKN